MSSSSPLPSPATLSSQLNDSATQLFQVLSHIEGGLVKGGDSESSDFSTLMQPFARLRHLHHSLSSLPSVVRQHQRAAEFRVAQHADRLSLLRDRLRRMQASIRRTRQECLSIVMPVPPPEGVTDHEEIVQSLDAEHSRRREMGKRTSGLRAEAQRLQSEESKVTKSLNALQGLSSDFFRARDAVVGNESLDDVFGVGADHGGAFCRPPAVDSGTAGGPEKQKRSETAEQKQMRLLPSPLYCLFHVVRDLSNRLKESNRERDEDLDFPDRMDEGGEEEEEEQEEEGETDGRSSSRSSAAVAASAGPKWHVDVRIVGRLPDDPDDFEHGNLHHRHKRRRLSPPDRFKVFPLHLRIFVRRSKLASLGDNVTSSPSGRDHQRIIVVCFDVKYLVNVDLVIVKGVVPADERIVRAMWYGDDGARTPNMHVMNDVNFAKWNGHGRPYRWAQQMCGLHFYPPQTELPDPPPTMELGPVISFRDVFDRIMFRSEVTRTFRGSIRALKESAIAMPTSLVLRNFTETTGEGDGDAAIDRSYRFVLEYENLARFRVVGTAEVSRYYPFEPSRFSVRLTEGRLRERGPADGVPDEWAALNRSGIIDEGGDSSDVRMRDVDDGGGGSGESEDYSPSLADLEIRANLFRPRNRSELVDLLRRQFGILARGLAELFQAEENGGGVDEDKRPVYQ